MTKKKVDSIIEKEFYFLIYNMTSQNLNSTTDMNELNGGNIDHLLNIKNLLERLDQIGIQQVDVQQQLTTMSLKDTQKAIDDTIKAIKKNNDTEDDRYIQALQELQKDPTNRRKAWEIKIAMEKQKINQNLKNITNEEYGDDANTLRINEINKLVALTNGDDLRNMKEELVLNL